MAWKIQGKNWRLTDRHIYDTENNGHSDYRVAVVFVGSFESKSNLPIGGSSIIAEQLIDFFRFYNPNEGCVIS